MPSERTLLYAGTEFTVEHVCSRTHGPDWSAQYTIDSRRIVLPVGRTVLDVRSGDSTWLVDGLTAMHLHDAMVYQLRPSSAHAPRHSMVVSGHGSPQASEAPVFSLLSPAALYRVHATQRQLLSGGAGPRVVTSLLEELGTARRLMPLNGTVARAKRLLAETADREARLSMHALADAVSRSPFHLARSFRQQTGLSLHQYRQHLRLATAMDRLTSGDRDLAGIAHDLGYCSQSHLGAVFRREVGVTLGEARRTLATARI
ncbi:MULTISPECIES: helix-turn-helix domain-containing protein [Variovorax]|jgi:AraC-like DNA-binding protein|uniref:helix-turn-helix domain-containing protein n=1 Tax=Variovorax TaxID=34072 RepID=UPI00086AF040|nr:MULTISPECIES: AraC family transcriptional regulator [Variovorax]MBN8752637.1 helix-turn-helix transcriptional regulator [Variovorax sp.]ODU16276.1 MAG: AraC family transcriptional regulator [Variovorax sp. SCN 67-85]ODV26027.1 MAG: AraC family transcriptional regulator [Variovorax sp. SCN 67-20]OJZ10238.1 MAG: AraC family transcriptional regulator [Variovorax sp. 67-131]UKI06869.1 AraC family transcriptional regulator [Variovorax paradoxus]